MTIHNSFEYASAMSRASNQAMTGCIMIAIRDLQQFTMRNLYGKYFPSSYERTGQMKNAWTGLHNYNYGMIKFDAGTLGQNETLGQHTSIMGMGSLGSALLDVLEAGYRGFNAKTGKAIPARPFFTQWKSARANRYIGAWYRKGLEKQGLKVLGR